MQHYPKVLLGVFALLDQISYVDMASILSRLPQRVLCFSQPPCNVILLSQIKIYLKRENQSRLETMFGLGLGFLLEKNLHLRGAAVQGSMIGAGVGSSVGGMIGSKDEEQDKKKEGVKRPSWPNPRHSKILFQTCSHFDFESRKKRLEWYDPSVTPE